MRSRASIQNGILAGRVWGVPIYVHASWFVIFIVLAWSMAVGILPQGHPEFSVAALWLLGILTSLLFALSVLLHELGHSYAALRNSIPVKNVTLFVFGGMAQISQEPPSAGVEFTIAMAGPLVSLALGLCFAAVSLLAPNLAYLSAPSAWLARINLSLLAFNMIPAFPLDGGRVLRSILWHFSKDQVSATHSTAITGTVIALGFIAAGLYSIASGNLYDGLWLIFIGWFLQGASSAVLADEAVAARKSHDRPFQPGYQPGVPLSGFRHAVARHSVQSAVDHGAWLGGLPLLSGTMPALGVRGDGPQTRPGWYPRRWGKHAGISRKGFHYARCARYARRSRNMKLNQAGLVARHSVQIRRGRCDRI